MSMRELHLFAGVGGGILAGMLLGHRCVGAVEIDPYCRKVLLCTNCACTRAPLRVMESALDRHPELGGESVKGE